MNIPEVCLKWISMHRTHLSDPMEYAEDVEKDFEQIKPYLPNKVGSILDIGCGVSGIDVFLKRLYPKAKLTLLDSNGQDWGAGWNQEMKPFTSRNAAEALIEANGFRVDEWKDVGTKEELKADLIISLLSWGFHYPLDTYKTEGYVIADLRLGREHPRGRIIATTRKFNRCAFHLPPEAEGNAVRDDSSVS